MTVATESDHFNSVHWNDVNDNPAGGRTYGVGFNINWQDGPLAVDGVRKEPNGAFVEWLIEAVIDRIEYYQESKFNNEYNARALDHLNWALASLNDRTKDREARNVEGTHSI